jgi:hypothetical protein
MRCSEVSELNARELDLLERIQAKPELRTLFFRRVRGLKWFDSLSAAGYFKAENLPRPRQSKQEGYFQIPRWEVGDYLVKTAPELATEAGARYAPRFVEIISAATEFAKREGFGNYQAWWQFAGAVSSMPSHLVPTEFLDTVDYWLEDNFDRGLVASELGEKWLVRLLEEGTGHTFDLVERLLRLLYKVAARAEKPGSTKQKASLRVDYHHAIRIVGKAAELSGRRLGVRAVRVFQEALEAVLNIENSDTWSAIWQPAVEDHAQNEYRHDPENILLYGLRDSLNGFLLADPGNGATYIEGMLGSGRETIRRVAIYGVTEHFLSCDSHADIVIDPRHFTTNFRHETWHFLNRCYGQLDDKQRDRVVATISYRQRYGEQGELLEAATAYDHAGWFAAIKDFGPKESALYREAVKAAQSEPEHPDFSSFMSVGWVEPESPVTLTQLAALSKTDLVTTLAAVKEEGRWREPGIEGLSKTFKELIKSAPLRFYTDLSSFAHLDPAYVHSIVDGYSELWNEKAQLPWEEIWGHLLSFCSEVVNSGAFWDQGQAKPRPDFVANRHWIVSSIGRLVESGTKSDEHAIAEKYHEQAESLLAVLLERQEGEEFREESDAVSVAINSPRGRCLEALINLTLRMCRLSDRQHDKDHAAAWAKHQSYYDRELTRYKVGGYEFSTLVTNYLPNFLYMSGDWVQRSLDIMFDQADRQHWLCAMQGYAYVNVVYEQIYRFLKRHGDFVKALEDNATRDKVSDKVVQNIVLAFLNGMEEPSEEGNLMDLLLSRRDSKELQEVIWFVWTMRGQDDADRRTKIFQLWHKLAARLDLSTREGQRLASHLCRWSVFVDTLDKPTKDLLMNLAPFADEAHNSPELLESLAKLSGQQPFEAHEIWMRMLEHSAPDYPEEAITALLSALVARGDAGKRAARDAVSEYLKHAVERPDRLLKVLLKGG